MPESMATRISQLAEKQDLEIRRQRDNVERLRSIFGRLHTFAQQGWFLLGEEGQQDRWLRADAVMEILTAAEMIVDELPTAPLVDGATAPFGIHSMGAKPASASGLPFPIFHPDDTPPLDR